MNWRCWVSVVSIVFAFSMVQPTEANSGSRQHRITLEGALAKEAPKILTVDLLAKDFPKLQSLKTSWREEGELELEGVPLREIVKKYAAPGVTKARVTGIDHYSQVLTPLDWDELQALLAFKEKGEIISTKKRGTFRVVYDFNKYKADPKAFQIFETNSVWQVVRIEFLK